jgi:glycosyl transferase family 25
MAVYLINMDKATDRLADMERKTQKIGLSFERMAGVDGRKLSFPTPEFSEISYKVLHGRRTIPPEVGCYLSHVECARRLLASNADLALILEDDVSFEQDFLDSVDSAALHRDDWDILRLTTVNRGRKYAFRNLKSGRKLAIALTREKGAGAYVINRKAARWIVEKLMPMRLAYDIAFDLEYLSGLRAAFIYPLVASQHSDHETQIQTNIKQYKLPVWRYLTVLPYRTYLEVTRFIMRGFTLARHKLARN